MALPRRKSPVASIASPRSKRKLSHAERLQFISQYARVDDPTNRHAVEKQYKLYRKFPLYLQKSATKNQITDLKAHGFFTTHKGVIVDGPRDARRKPIPGVRFNILKAGVVSYSVKSRRDYIQGFTLEEKQRFAENYKKVVDEAEAAFRKKHRLSKKVDVQIRLQWGAYQATKDFSAGYF